ncbi:hypothetical protein BASA60_005755 [Batrachochytrium salamandrivorans]|nr:hypothetical protein BASA60_005755 [Batrachochytrium salamandrivorans]
MNSQSDNHIRQGWSDTKARPELSRNHSPTTPASVYSNNAQAQYTPSSPSKPRFVSGNRAPMSNTATPETDLLDYRALSSAVVGETTTLQRHTTSDALPNPDCSPHQQHQPTQPSCSHSSLQTQPLIQDVPTNEEPKLQHQSQTQSSSTLPATLSALNFPDVSLQTSSSPLTDLSMTGRSSPMSPLSDFARHSSQSSTLSHAGMGESRYIEKAYIDRSNSGCDDRHLVPSPTPYHNKSRAHSGGDDMDARSSADPDEKSTVKGGSHGSTQIGVRSEALTKPRQKKKIKEWERVQAERYLELQRRNTAKDSARKSGNDHGNGHGHGHGRIDDHHSFDSGRRSDGDGKPHALRVSANTDGTRPPTTSGGRAGLSVSTMKLSPHSNTGGPPSFGVYRSRTSPSMRNSDGQAQSPGGGLGSGVLYDEGSATTATSITGGGRAHAPTASLQRGPKRNSSASDLHSRHLPGDADESVILPDRKRPIPVSTINATDRSGRTLLFKYTTRGDLSTCTSLLRAGIDVNLADHAGYTALHEACLDGHTEIVQRMLDYGAGIDSPGGTEGDTPLHDAISNGHVDVVDVLLRHGASIVSVNTALQTPMVLAHACQVDVDAAVSAETRLDGCDNMSMDGSIVKHEDDCTDKDNQQQHRHHHQEKHQSSVENVSRRDRFGLESDGSNRTSRDGDSRSETPFKATAMNHHSNDNSSSFVNPSVRLKRLFSDQQRARAIVDLLETWQDMTSKVVQRDLSGQTLLHKACTSGDLDRIHQLLMYGADINVADHSGWTPLHDAALHGHTLCVQVLLRYGADVQKVGGSDADSPLHDAAANCHCDVVRLLLEYGADPLLVNSNNQTPLDLCSVQRKPAALASLLAPDGQDTAAYDRHKNNTKANTDALMDSRRSDIIQMLSRSAQSWRPLRNAEFYRRPVDSPAGSGELGDMSLHAARIDPMMDSDAVNCTFPRRASDAGSRSPHSAQSNPSTLQSKSTVYIAGDHRRHSVGGAVSGSSFSTAAHGEEGGSAIGTTGPRGGGSSSSSSGNVGCNGSGSLDDRNLLAGLPSSSHAASYRFAWGGLDPRTGPFESTREEKKFQALWRTIAKEEGGGGSSNSNSNSSHISTALDTLPISGDRASASRHTSGAVSGSPESTARSNRVTGDIPRKKKRGTAGHSTTASTSALPSSTTLSTNHRASGSVSKGAMDQSERNPASRNAITHTADTSVTSLKSVHPSHDKSSHVDSDNSSILSHVDEEGRVKYKESSHRSHQHPQSFSEDSHTSRLGESSSLARAGKPPQSTTANRADYHNADSDSGIRASRREPWTSMADERSSGNDRRVDDRNNSDRDVSGRSLYKTTVVDTSDSDNRDRPQGIKRKGTKKHGNSRNERMASDSNAGDIGSTKKIRSSGGDSSSSTIASTSAHSNSTFAASKSSISPRLFPIDADERDRTLKRKPRLDGGSSHEAASLSSRSAAGRDSKRIKTDAVAAIPFRTKYGDGSFAHASGSGRDGSDAMVIQGISGDIHTKMSDHTDVWHDQKAASHSVTSTNDTKRSTPLVLPTEMPVSSSSSATGTTVFANGVKTTKKLRKSGEMHDAAVLARSHADEYAIESEQSATAIKAQREREQLLQMFGDDDSNDSDTLNFTSDDRSKKTKVSAPIGNHGASGTGDRAIETISVSTLSSNSGDKRGADMTSASKATGSSAGISSTTIGTSLPSVKVSELASPMISRIASTSSVSSSLGKSAKNMAVSSSYVKSSASMSSTPPSATTTTPVVSAPTVSRIKKKKKTWLGISGYQRAGVQGVVSATGPPDASSLAVGSGDICDDSSAENSDSMHGVLSSSAASSDGIHMRVNGSTNEVVAPVSGGDLDVAANSRSTVEVDRGDVLPGSVSHISHASVLSSTLDVSTLMTAASAPVTTTPEILVATLSNSGSNNISTVPTVSCQASPAVTTLAPSGQLKASNFMEIPASTKSLMPAVTTGVKENSLVTSPSLSSAAAPATGHFRTNSASSVSIEKRSSTIPRSADSTAPSQLPLQSSPPLSTLSTAVENHIHPSSTQSSTLPIKATSSTTHPPPSEAVSTRIAAIKGLYQAHCLPLYTLESRIRLPGAAAIPLASTSKSNAAVTPTAATTAAVRVPQTTVSNKTYLVDLQLALFLGLKSGRALLDKYPNLDCRVASMAEKQQLEQSVVAETVYTCMVHCSPGSVKWVKTIMREGSEGGAGTALKVTDLDIHLVLLESCLKVVPLIPRLHSVFGGSLGSFVEATDTPFVVVDLVLSCDGKCQIVGGRADLGQGSSGSSSSTTAVSSHAISGAMLASSLSVSLTTDTPAKLISTSPSLAVATPAAHTAKLHSQPSSGGSMYVHKLKRSAG